MTKPIDLLSAVKELIRKEVNDGLRARLFGTEARRPPRPADRLRCADCGAAFGGMTAYMSHRRWAHRAKASS